MFYFWSLFHSTKNEIVCKNTIVGDGTKTKWQNSKNAVRAASERTLAIARFVDIVNSPSTTISNQNRCQEILFYYE